MRNFIFKLLSIYSHETDGSIAGVFGVTAPLLIICVGVAYDTSQLTNTKGQAQLMADNIGLNASIFVKENDRTPENIAEGYVHDQWYSGNELGLSFGHGVVGNNKTRFKVSYDDVGEQVVVEVETDIKPAFMQISGNRSVEFTTLSVVKYAKKAYTNPASIFLVVDNSGSMAFDDKPQSYQWGPTPAGTRPRITGMKEALSDFNEHLSKTIVPDQSNPDRKFLRMGMTAYNTNIINSRTVSPRWGTIPDNNINSMVADGGTVPTQALQRVQSWMTSEDTLHEAVNGSDEPLKYVILMADGANSYSNTDAQSLAVCNSLKANGVEVFTIGYALEPGYFYTGTWGVKYNSPNYYISPSVKDNAQDFLRDCASSSQHFILAEDTDALKVAFDKIGEEIVDDAIRVAS